MRTALPLTAMLLAAAALPGRALAEPCRGDRGDGTAVRFEDAAKADAAARAGASLLGSASFAGLAVTSVAEGPLSLAAVDEAVDDVVAVPVVPEGPRAAAPAPPLEAPRRAPMCTGSPDDDPRCQPIPPGPEQGPELRHGPFRTVGPRPPTVGGAAPADALAVAPAAEGEPRPGTRSRLERPPRD